MRKENHLCIVHLKKSQHTLKTAEQTAVKLSLKPDMTCLYGPDLAFM
ncbi:hypothetical protein VSK90_11670 [Bacillus swezeyi]